MTRIPSAAQEKTDLTESKMFCWLAVGVRSPRVYTQTQEWSRTHVKDPVFHVRVGGLRKHEKTQHVHLELGSAALAAVVAVPEEGGLNFPQWVNESVKKEERKPIGKGDC